METDGRGLISRTTEVPVVAGELMAMILGAGVPGPTLRGRPSQARREARTVHEAPPRAKTRSSPKDG